MIENDNLGITCKQLMVVFNSSQSHVSSYLTNLKYRGLIYNIRTKWYYCKHIELLDDCIEISLHNGNIEIWEI